MTPLSRSILAVLAGTMAALIAIMVVQWVSAMVYPPPPGFDPNDREALKALVASLPLGGFLLILSSYLLGASLGGYLAARMAPSRRPVHAGIIALLLVVASVLNLRAVPHPPWFWGANLIIVAAVPLLAARLAEPHAVVAHGEV